MADSVILPAGCPLSFSEREVFYNTQGEHEVPCLGCFKRAKCSVRVDQGIRFAHKIMDEPVPPTRVCNRCKAPLVEWKISGSFRFWKCKAPVNEMICGWELSEVGSTISNF